MQGINRVGGANGVKAIVGSGFYWAWFDALFMSALFATGGTDGLMPEYGAIAAFALSLPVFGLVLWRGDVVGKLFESRRMTVAVAVAGTIGSLFYTVAGMANNWGAFAGGALLCGLFMGMYNMAWGMVYCKDGAKSATPLIAGAFAIAPLLDAPLLFMIPEARAVFFALFPLASSALFVAMGHSLTRKTKRRDATANAQTSEAAFRPLTDTMDVGSRLDESLAKSLGRPQTEPAASPHGMQAFLTNHLGVSAMLIGAVVLVMSGFGYLQHLLSFSAQANGIGVQVARGAAAIVMFCLLVARPERSSAVFRVGFLIMVAGIMMLPFFFGTDTFLVSGAVIIAGYTAFDVFIWVAFSHVAHTRSKSPVKTVAFIRFVANAATALGLVCGVLLVGQEEGANPLAFQETTVVGYLVVIAIVMLLSSEESAELLRSARPSPAQSTGMVGAMGETSAERMEAWLDGIGLTAREKDVADLLLQGRTQPWIAEALGISENTVGTHVRHIYQKAEVHDRQQLLDLALSSISPESREPQSTITGAT